MSADLIAVLDIGKTNARIVFVDARSGAEVWSEKRANQLVTTAHGRELDIHEIERWLLRALQGAANKARVTAIVPVAHGAAAVLLNAQGKAVAAPDYEDSQFERVNDAYERERDGFEHTFSPSLPCGLNLARQLFFLERERPALFSAVAHILPYPQYWAWRLSATLASEVTSLGCHTDLWRPRSSEFSALARTHDWVRLLPRARFAGDVLGTITSEVAALTGLDRECRVVCGIHDSNASYLQHAFERSRADSFAVISSGTWTVVMASATDPSRLRAERDMLANVDAFGAIVGTARFMGGREYEAIAGSATAPEGREHRQGQDLHSQALSTVLRQQAMAIPSFASGGPFATHQGTVLNADGLSKPERAALASLYTALMTELLLESLDVRDDTIVDGPLSTNPLFGPLLAALRSSSRILVGSAGASGVRAACRLAGAELPRAEGLCAYQPLHAEGLATYRSAWRDLLPDRLDRSAR